MIGLRKAGNQAKGRAWVNQMTILRKGPRSNPLPLGEEDRKVNEGTKRRLGRQLLPNLLLMDVYRELPGHQSQGPDTMVGRGPSSRNQIGEELGTRRPPGASKANDERQS